MNMITGEMDWIVILEDAQDYVLRQRNDSRTVGGWRDTKDALQRAATKLAYRKQCIQSYLFSIVRVKNDHVPWFFDWKKRRNTTTYDEEFEFPPENSKALRAVDSAGEWV